MLSKKPLLNSNSSLDSPFLRQNASKLDSIKLFADLSEGFTFGCMVVNSDLDRELVVDYFRAINQPSSVQWISIKLEDENLQYFGLEVKQRLQAINLLNDQKPVLLISGLENSIGVNGEYPEILVNMNMERDDYPRILPYPIILLLPSYAVIRMARYAPDFWDWKSTEVQLNTCMIKINHPFLLNPAFIECGKQESLQPYLTNEKIDFYKKIIQAGNWQLLAMLLSENPADIHFVKNEIDKQRNDMPIQMKAIEILINNDTLEGWELEEIAKEILQGILMEIRQTIETSKASNTAAKIAKETANPRFDFLTKMLSSNLESATYRARLLHQLGDEYRHFYNNTEAEKAYQSALDIYKNSPSLLDESISLSGLAEIYELQGKYLESLELWQKSLVIQIEIGDQLGQAFSLYHLSKIHEQQGELSKSLNYSEQSLQINMEIGSQKGTADSLGQTSNIYRASGELLKSLDYSKQALKIYQKIDDRKGEADSLCQLSITHEELGNSSEALTYFEQSLEIYQEIGDQPGEANALYIKSKIYQSLGEFQESMNLAVQALKICQEIDKQRYNKFH